MNPAPMQRKPSIPVIKKVVSTSTEIARLKMPMNLTAFAKITILIGDLFPDSTGKEEGDYFVVYEKTELPEVHNLEQ